jgi:hypothetical protein
MNVTDLTKLTKIVKSLLGIEVIGTELRFRETVVISDALSESPYRFHSLSELAQEVMLVTGIQEMLFFFVVFLIPSKQIPG